MTGDVEGQPVTIHLITQARCLVRLQKFLAEAGVASRRHCEQLIVAGKISVNGQPVVTLGTKIDPERDRVAVAGQPVAIEHKVYIALNKPAGILCTNRDTHRRKRAVDLLPRSLPRLYTVGRLDKDTEGLLLLTNDGTFSLRLTHPRYKMSKTYLVEVEGELKNAEIARLLEGVRSEGELLRAEKVFAVRAQKKIHRIAPGSRRGKETTNSQNDGKHRASREASRAPRDWPGRIGEFGNITMEVSHS